MKHGILKLKNRKISIDYDCFVSQFFVFNLSCGIGCALLSCSETCVIIWILYWIHTGNKLPYTRSIVFLYTGTHPNWIVVQLRRMFANRFVWSLGQPYIEQQRRARPSIQFHLGMRLTCASHPADTLKTEWIDVFHNSQVIAHNKQTQWQKSWSPSK